MVTRTLGSRRIATAVAAVVLTGIAANGLAQPPDEPQANPDATSHARPNPLAANATTEDWPWFLGPRHDGVSNESPLRKEWPNAGPTLVWEMKTGEGYAAPSIVGDRLIYTYRRDNEIRVDCVHPEDGQRWWRHSYPTSYRDRYGFNGGPRSSPVIVDERAYVYGPSGELICLKLNSGDVVWKKNLSKQFGIKQDFFGVGTTPLFLDDKLIINIGAPGGPCVIALNAKTGDEVWRSGNEWGASYASPTPATFHGKQRVLVLAGGDSDPPVGGLLVIDPIDGRIEFRYPFRSRKYESVIAASPIAFGNSIFITSSYRVGGALIDVQPDMTYDVRWTTNKLGSHWATPFYDDGYLYGVDGEKPNSAALVCLNAKTGEEVWRDPMTWEQSRADGTMDTAYALRTSMIRADGAYVALGEQGWLMRMRLSREGAVVTHRAQLFTARESFVAPIISRGLLYVSQTQPDRTTGEARLLCYDLRGG